MKILFALLTALAVVVATDGGYISNCRNVSIVNLDSNHIGLRAYCDADTSAPRCSIMDLDLCYGTTGEYLKLEARDNGMLSRNCTTDSCVLQTDTPAHITVLSCRCRNRSKESRSTKETNDIISNNNGTLKCFENLGTTPPDCAQIATKSGSRAKYLPSWIFVYIFIPLYLIWW
ncbi:hypothetical protein Hte_008088 [Hypoxylon texense]